MTTKQIEESRTKVESAKAEWQAKLALASSMRQDLQNSIRPKHVAEFCGVIRESDSLLSLHVQRYGSLLTQCDKVDN